MAMADTDESRFESQNPDVEFFSYDNDPELYASIEEVDEDEDVQMMDLDME